MSVLRRHGSRIKIKIRTNVESREKNHCSFTLEKKSLEIMRNVRETTVIGHEKMTGGAEKLERET